MPTRLHQVSIAWCGAAIGGLSPIPHTQPAMAEPFHAELGIGLDWIDVAYGEPATHGSGVILRGEPIILKLELVNRVRGQRAAAEADWIERIALTLRRGGRFDATSAGVRELVCKDDPRIVSARGSARSGEDVILEPGGSEVVACDVSQALTAMEAGTYTVIAQWGPSANARALPERRTPPLPAIMEFEYRDVKESGDEVDLANHLARRAYFKGELDEAERFVEHSLRLHPGGRVGAFIQAEVLEARGDCVEARRAFQRLAASYERGPDVRNRTEFELDDGDRRHRAERLRARASGLGCR